MPMVGLSDALGLELHTPAIWVLGSELWFSARATSTFYYGSISSVPLSLFTFLWSLSLNMGLIWSCRPKHLSASSWISWNAGSWDISSQDLAVIFKSEELCIGEIICRWAGWYLQIASSSIPLARRSHQTSALIDAHLGCSILFNYLLPDCRPTKDPKPELPSWAHSQNCERW